MKKVVEKEVGRRRWCGDGGCFCLGRRVRHEYIKLILDLAWFLEAPAAKRSRDDDVVRCSLNPQRFREMPCRFINTQSPHLCSQNLATSRSVQTDIQLPPRNTCQTDNPHIYINNVDYPSP